MRVGRCVLCWRCRRVVLGAAAALVVISCVVVLQRSRSAELLHIGALTAQMDVSCAPRVRSRELGVAVAKPPPLHGSSSTRLPLPRAAAVPMPPPSRFCLVQAQNGLYLEGGTAAGSGNMMPAHRGMFTDSAGGVAKASALPAGSTALSPAAPSVGAPAPLSPAEQAARASEAKNLKNPVYSDPIM